MTHNDIKLMTVTIQDYDGNGYSSAVGEVMYGVIIGLLGREYPFVSIGKIESMLLTDLNNEPGIGYEFRPSSNEPLNFEGDE